MKIKVEFEVELSKLDKTVDWSDIDSWLKYNLGATGGMKMENPFVDYDLDNASDVYWQEI